MNRQRTRSVVPLAALTLASMALFGCGRDDATQAMTDSHRDAKFAQIERPADTGAATAERGTNSAASATRDAAHDARVASREVVQDVGNKVADAVITTSVNAEIARDDKLSALHIDVDTQDGRVMLKGTAPSQADKERATQLAEGVKGVTGVENQLRVEPS